MSVGCNIKHRVVDSITLLAIPLRLLFETMFEKTNAHRLAVIVYTRVVAHITT